MDIDAKSDAFELRVEGATVVVAGDIDLATAPRLTEAIAGITAGPVVLDLARVHFMDSSGIGVVVAACARLAAEGRALSVEGRSAAVDRVFGIAGVDEILANRS